MPNYCCTSWTDTDYLLQASALGLGGAELGPQQCCGGGALLLLLLLLLLLRFFIGAATPTCSCACPCCCSLLPSHSGRLLQVLRNDRRHKAMPAGALSAHAHTHAHTSRPRGAFVVFVVVGPRVSLQPLSSPLTQLRRCQIQIRIRLICGTQSSLRQIQQQDCIISAT